MDARDVQNQVKYIPLRLTGEERSASPLKSDVTASCEACWAS